MKRRAATTISTPGSMDWSITSFSRRARAASLRRTGTAAPVRHATAMSKPPTPCACSRERFASLMSSTGRSSLNGAPAIHATQLCRHYRMGETLIRAVDGVTLTVAAGEFVALLGSSGSGKSSVLNLVDGLAREALARVGLEARMNHRPSELSGGEQQRAALARALINRPQLLLADEPTGNLDSHTGTEIMDMVSDFNQQLGMTVVMVTHERALAERYAQRLIFLADGKLIGDESNPAVADKPEPVRTEGGQP